MVHQVDFNIIKKLIQKELLNELYKNGVITFHDANTIIKNLDANIDDLKLQINNDNMRNIIIKIPV